LCAVVDHDTLAALTLRGAPTDMSTTEQATTIPSATAPITDGARRLDPARSSVAFHVRDV
jgi:hypothetical protein